MTCVCVIQPDRIYGCEWGPSFALISSRPQPFSAKWQLVGRSAVPNGIAESCARCACVHYRAQVAPPRLSDILLGLAESPMMTLYRETQHARFSFRTIYELYPKWWFVAGISECAYMVIRCICVYTIIWQMRECKYSEYSLQALISYSSRIRSKCTSRTAAQFAQIDNDNLLYRMVRMVSMVRILSRPCSKCEHTSV